MTDIIGCRLCLASDVQMYLITNSQLLNVYESLTGISISTDENKIKTVCYLCITKLKKCLAFKMQSLRAHEVLTKFLSGNFKITQQVFSNIDRKSYNLIPSLTVSTIKDHDFVYINEEKDKEIETRCSLKQEPVKSNVIDFNCVDVKTEFVECDMNISIKLEQEETPQEEDHQTYNHTYYESSESEEKVNLTPYQNRLKGKKTYKRSDEVMSGSSPTEAKKLKGRKAKNKNASESKKLGLDNDIENVQMEYLPLHVEILEEKITDDHVNRLESDKSTFTRHEVTSFEEIINKNKTKSDEIEKENGNFSCDQCVYQTIFKGSFLRHAMLHDLSRPYICDHCGFRFPQKATLSRHIKNLHLRGQFRLAMREARLKNNLKRSLRTDIEDKPFVCTVCDFKCSRKDRLDRHVRKHTGEKPFSCTFCQYKCSEKRTLKRHLKTHTGEKPFECTLCTFKSADKNGLQIHLRRHAGDKPFACTYCDYKSCVKYYLKSHLRTHTGEKPFNCSLCSFKCASNSYLTTHLRTHTGDKPFACPNCEYRSSDRGSMTKHIKTYCKKKS